MRLLLPAMALIAAMALPIPSRAETREFTIAIKNHRFEPAEITVPAGKKVKLVIDNRDGTPEEFESHDLKREKVIAGKTKGVIWIGPLSPGKYRFFGEFHEATAQGVLIAK